MEQEMIVQDEPLTAKMAWQREHRQSFKEKHGYSETSYYATGKLRPVVLARDNYRCVKCGMTDSEHKNRWNRPITIDHKDKNRKNNHLSNLQTLCLRCHSSKDISPVLIVQRIPQWKDEILKRRQNLEPYQKIADDLGFSIAAIWKWCKKWEAENGD